MFVLFITEVILVLFTKNSDEVVMSVEVVVRVGVFIKRLAGSFCEINITDSDHIVNGEWLYPRCMRTI